LAKLADDLCDRAGGDVGLILAEKKFAARLRAVE